MLPKIPQRPPPSSSSPALARVVSRIRSCEGQGDEPRDGAVFLTGTIDRQDQAGLIEALAGRLLDSEPEWKRHLPGGVNTSRLRVFAIRSELLPKLRADFANANAQPTANPNLFRQDAH